MVWAASLERLLEVIWDSLGGHLLAFTLSGGHERVPRPLLVLLLLRAVRGAFASILFSLRLTAGAIDNHSNRLLARGMVGGDVEERLGGLWALAPQLMD
jgi:hypothetical protein